MPELVDLLERVGKDARLRHASRAQLDNELASAGIDAGARTALLDGDTARLEALLGASPNVCCMVYAADA